jgi:hypothetical protein
MSSSPRERAPTPTTVADTENIENADFEFTESQVSAHSQSAPKKRSVRFAEDVEEFSTYSIEEYDRTPDYEQIMHTMQAYHRRQLAEQLRQQQLSCSLQALCRQSSFNAQNMGVPQLQMPANSSDINPYSSFDEDEEDVFDMDDFSSEEDGTEDEYDSDYHRNHLPVSSAMLSVQGSNVSQSSQSPSFEGRGTSSGGLSVATAASQSLDAAASCENCSEASSEHVSRISKKRSASEFEPELVSQHEDRKQKLTHPAFVQGMVLDSGSSSPIEAN